jgi:hypothetical protein
MEYTEVFGGKQFAKTKPKVTRSSFEVHRSLLGVRNYFGCSKMKGRLDTLTQNFFLKGRI